MTGIDTEHDVRAFQMAAKHCKTIDELIALWGDAAANGSQRDPRVIQAKDQRKAELEAEK